MDHFLKPTRALFKVARPFFVLVACVACADNSPSQTPKPGLGAGGEVRLRRTDLAVLESQQPQRELPCSVTTPKPELGFDFMFHTGYEVRVPIRELAGKGNVLTVFFRVVPQDRPDRPSYMAQTIRVPPLEDRSKRQIKFYGTFKLGEGKYHVDWLVRDQRERFCAKSWDLESKLNSRDRQLRQWIPQALVQVPEPLFAQEPPVIREKNGGLSRYSIIVNLDPPDPSAVLIEDWEVYRLVAILRRMERDPRIEPCSIIICSFQAQQIVYQQENTASLDLPALGEAFRSLKLGTVDATQLASTHGPTRFAADLIRQQLMKVDPDALVVLGPKGGSETGVSRRTLKEFGKPGKPAFYLSYDTDSIRWRDPISSIIKHLRGFEYSINRPKDFFNAWSDVVARIARTKQIPYATTVSAPAPR